MQPVHDRGTGNAFSFGSGQFGQLGLGEDVLKRNYPSLIDSLEKMQVKTNSRKMTKINEANVSSNEFCPVRSSSLWWSAYCCFGCTRRSLDIWM
jgi:hypothetical protein